MNYYAYKFREKFYRTIFKIGFVKKLYIGNEMLKNPPTVWINGSNVAKNLKTQNTTMIFGKGTTRTENCHFINTLKLGRYF